MTRAASCSSRWIKRAVLVKLLAAAALLTGGCVPIAVEQHGGLSPVPSKVPDIGFIGIGVGIDAGLQLAKVPAVPRVLADVLAAFVVRNVSTFGRSADSGFLMVFGAIPTEIGGVTLHYLKHPSHPNCYKYVGPDTMVTVPVELKAIDGRMWGNECLSWDEERKLRHEN